MAGIAHLTALEPVDAPVQLGFRVLHGHDVFRNEMVHIWRCACRCWHPWYVTECGSCGDERDIDAP